MNPNIAKGAAAVGAVAALVLGAAAIGGGSSSSSASGAGTSAPGGAGGQVPQQQQSQQQVPGSGGGPPGFGTEVTGTAARKASAAALASYDGQVERVQQLTDGSYVVHVITSSGEVHVAVSRTFEVTGTAQGPGGGRPDRAGAPPSGSAPSAPATTTGDTVKS